MPRRRDDGFSDADAQSIFNAFSRLDPRMQTAVAILVVIAAIVFGLAYLQSSHSTPGISTQAPQSPQMLLGNPSHATAATGDIDNYLMLKPYFALSYNSTKGIPNWVSWRVTFSDLGTAPRKPEFDPDDTLPVGFSKIKQSDYSVSGFDRGHMCPHSDRGGNLEMSYATFIMTNIIPQAPNVNRKAWEQLEVYGRDLVHQHHDHLYITAGPAGQGGVGSKGPKETLAHGIVTVPAECWKIIVDVPESGGDDDLAKINSQTRVISVIMPNDNEKVGEEWDKFRTSPTEIERHTGLHFFETLPSNVAEALRNKVDTEEISPPRPHGHRE